jgi:hypothetical protein
LNPGERPFDNYRTAITDPPQFFGRDEWLGEMRRAPFWVRVLLGGRRLGKTSALRAVEWSLLDLGGPRANRPFPVFISLELEQPSDLPTFSSSWWTSFKERWIAAIEALGKISGRRTAPFLSVCPRSR